MNEKDKKVNRRRNALLKMAGISGAAIGATQTMPKQWQAPVINSITLPAHAMTTETAPTAPSGPSPFAGTYAVALDNSGSFDGNCNDSSTFVPANAQVLVNMDGSIALFGLQFDGIVAPDGTINSSVSIPVDGGDDGDCTIVNNAQGQIVEGVIMGTLTSTQTCPTGCVIQVTTGFDGLQIS